MCGDVHLTATLHSRHYLCNLRSSYFNKEAVKRKLWNFYLSYESNAKIFVEGVLFIFIMRQSEPGTPLQYFLVVFIIFQFVNNCPAVFSATKMTTSVNNNSRQGGLKNISVSTLKPCKPLHTVLMIISIEYKNIKVDQLI